MTLNEATKAYIEHLKSQGKKERTLYTYLKDLQQIEAFFRPERELSSILIPHVSMFLKSDKLLKLSNGKERAKPTVDKTKRVLRMFLIWAKDKGHIKTLPIPKNLSLGRNEKKQKETKNADASAKSIETPETMEASTDANH